VAIPSHQQWMIETGLGILKPRSQALKELDSAIEQYGRVRTQDNLFKIRNTFEAWKRSKGPTWQTSERNKNKALNTLERELMAAGADLRTYQLTGNRFTMQELQALAFIARERKQVITRVFEGKTVSFRNTPRKIKQTVADAADKVQSSCAEARTFLQGRSKSTLSTSDIAQQKLEAMVKSLFAVDTLESLGGLASFILDIVGKCGVSVAPVVGHVKDGYDLFVGWAKAGAALHTQHSIGNCHYIIDTGAPAAAFAGVKTCLVNETKNEAAGASIATTSFALKTGLVFADGGVVSGPVVGAATAMANLSLQLYWLATEWRATVAIKKALEANELDVRLFRTYPLMGCYLMTSATFSDLIPIDNFGTPGWMDYVESLKKRQFDGIYDAATELIDKSPWEIEGLPKRPNKSSGAQLGMLGLVKGTGSDVADIFSD
jgi:hypothetical protein